MPYTVEEYLDDYDVYVQDSPFYNSIKFDVIVFDTCTGEYIENTIWGESERIVRDDIVRLLSDCEVIDEIREHR